jgi:FKBP-type peptidyl-prolyl cis-trans isomerase FklB
MYFCALFQIAKLIFHYILFKLFIFMKNTFLKSLYCLFTMAFLVACGDTNNTAVDSSVYNLSYSYGAQMALSLQQSDLTEDEKNADKLVEGVQKALDKDSAAIEIANELIKTRVQSKKISETTEEANNVAFNLGVVMLGRLPFMDAIEATDFDVNGIKDGYVDASSSDSLKLTNTEMDSILQAYFEPKSKAYSEKMQAKQEADASVFIEQGVSFLAENAKKEGVITTESGLQYEVLKKGSGPKPTMESQVKTHYHGTLIDGTVFDSSVERGEPATFPVGGVIKGWQEGIPLMSVGAKYRFYIPNNLAYGMQAPSPKIPAGSALIFEVEVLEIKK